VDLSRAALVVVDVQQGFDDPWWGPRNNVACDDNIAVLAGEWASRGRPVVHVRHDSAEPDSPLHPDKPGNRLVVLENGEITAVGSHDELVQTSDTYARLQSAQLELAERIG